MSDTHAPHARRWIVRIALNAPCGYDLWHIIDTHTDLSYGCFAHDSARRIAARLNEKES